MDVGRGQRAWSRSWLRPDQALDTRVGSRCIGRPRARVAPSSRPRTERGRKRPISPPGPRGGEPAPFNADLEPPMIRKSRLSSVVSPLVALLAALVVAGVPA